MRVFLKEFLCGFKLVSFIGQIVMPASVCCQDYKIYVRVIYEKTRSRYRHFVEEPFALEVRGTQ